MNCVAAALLTISSQSQAGLLDEFMESVRGARDAVVNPIKNALEFIRLGREQGATGDLEIPPRLANGEYNYQGEKDYSIFALYQTHQNVNQYYQEAGQRYGALPSLIELNYATFLGMDRFYLSNLGFMKIADLTSPPANGGGWTVVSPKIPLVNRRVSPVDYTGFKTPMLPPMRFTLDGRVGLVPSSTGVDGVPQPLRIQLNRPELLTKNFLDSDAGLPTLSPIVFKVEDLNKWGLPGTKTTHSVSICEPKPTSPAEANPKACGINGKDDCYNVVLVADAVKTSYITSGRMGRKIEGATDKEKETFIGTKMLPQLEKEDVLYSRSMTIRVSNPKTAQAKIESVDFGVPVKGVTRTGVIFEVNTPADGRLITGRRTGLPLVWKHSTKGDMRVGSYEMVYAVAPDNAKPCDVTQWGEFYPITHAPYDPRMKKYDFAKYPFRDPMGNLITDGAEMKGTYPWLDPEAKMMMLQMNGGDLYNGNKKDKSQHRFVNEGIYKTSQRPDIPGYVAYDETYVDLTNVNTHTTVGAWTKGKMVVFDNKLNFSDFRFPLSNSARLDLYEPNSALAATTNKSHKVDVIGAREQSFGHRQIDTYLPVKDVATGITHNMLLKNTTFFDSITNAMHYNPHMMPGAPHDVKWLVNSGATTDELNFDDMLNNNAFIVSNMVTAFSWVNPRGNHPFRFTAYDGWDAGKGDWSSQVKVQNAATTLPEKWVVPHSGDVVNGRIEPVGNGGVKGKGMYFNGTNTRILYNISSSQPQDMSKSTWFHSLFLDARELSTTVERVLIDFPDKSRLTMLDAGINVNLKAYNKHGELQKTIAVPSYLVKAKWFNFGIQRSANNLVTMFVNGYPYSEFTASSLFQMTGGDLVLGRAHNSYDYKYDWVREGLLDWKRVATATPVTYGAFKGWMDDYKVFAYQPDLETVCNLAHGTLVAPNTNTTIQTLAKLYPQAMHDKVSYALKMRGQWSTANYACYTGNPSQDKTAVLHSLPSGSIPVRTAMHFPEGPLYHDAPRPDSSSNEFCLACHSDGDKISGLSLKGALAVNPNLWAKYDKRRQPTQPHTFITGNMPAEFLRSIQPNNISNSNYIDDHTMKSSNGVLPGIWNLTLLNLEGKPVGVMPSVLTKGAFSGLRLNTSGLTKGVQFQVMSTSQLASSNDFSPPFEISASALANGTSLKVTAYGFNGQKSEYTYNYTLK